MACPTPLLDEPMTEKRRGDMTRVNPGILDECRIAAAHLGISLQEYISDRLLKAAQRDIEDAFKKRQAGEKPKR